MKRLARRAVLALRRGRGRANPLFDANWYLANYPDVQLSGYDAWEHYRRHGAPEGRDPNPLFRTGWYRQQYADVAASGLNPLDHYLAVGASKGNNPSMAFDTDWYLEQNPDVRRSGVNPLLHFLSQGREEGRAPRPMTSEVARAGPIRTAHAASVRTAERRHTSQRQTIVFVDQHVPEWDRSAGGLAMWHYVRLLAPELNVVFVAHDGVLADPYTSGLRQLGVEVVAGLGDARAWFAQHGGRVSWVVAARPTVEPAYRDLVRSASRARLMYFTHDLHFLRELRRAELDGGRAMPGHVLRLREEELRIVRSVDAVLTASTAEARLLAQLAPQVPVHVIPLLMFDPSELPDVDTLDFEGRQMAIFVGGFRHEPNVDAAQYLVSEIMPIVWQARPEQRLVLAGSDPPPEIQALAEPRVEVTGHVPDLAPYYARARVSVSPLRYGAGVKGKIIESLAACVPVVTTPMGNEGIDLVNGAEALIGADAHELARSTVAVLEDKQLALRLAASGRRVVEQRFSPPAARSALFAALGLRVAAPA